MFSLIVFQVDCDAKPMNVARGRKGWVSGQAHLDLGVTALILAKWFLIEHFL